MNVDNTLQERGNRYGSFDEHARITQAIKRAMVDSPNWATLPDDMKEALEMVAHKAGRILNGDPNYADSWHDIIGYTRLVEKRLCLAGTTPNTSNEIKSDQSRSGNVRPEIKPGTISSEPEKSIRGMASMSTIETPLQRVEATNHQTGE